MGDLTVLSAIRVLGYSIAEDPLVAATDRFPVLFVASDAGSIDQAPNYLGQ